MATAGEVILAARDVHPSFDPVRHSQGVLLRALARYQRRLLATIAPLRPDAIVAVHEIVLADYDFEAGEELPPHILVHGADVLYTAVPDHPDPLKLVGFADRHIQFAVPAGYYSRTHLFLNGVAAHWEGISQVNVRYFPRGTDQLGPTGTLFLPDSAQDCAVASLAYFMAQRTPAKDADPPINMQVFAADLAAAEKAYLDDVTGRAQVIVYNPVEQW